MVKESIDGMMSIHAEFFLGLFLFSSSKRSLVTDLVLPSVFLAPPLVTLDHRNSCSLAELTVQPVETYSQRKCDDSNVDLDFSFLFFDSREFKPSIEKIGRAHV